MNNLFNFLPLLLLLLIHHVQYCTVAEKLESSTSVSVQNTTDVRHIVLHNSGLAAGVSDSANFSKTINKDKNNVIVSENLIFARTSNSSVISSLGSIDVIVPSLPGAPEHVPHIPGKQPSSPQYIPRANLTGMIFPHMQKNRSHPQPDNPMLNHIFDAHSSQGKHSHRNDRFGGPKIEAVESSNISVDTDALAELECRVTSLQDKMVSWARRKPEDDNIEILTIGQQTYTADTRFSADFRQPDTWRLLLNRATFNDSGTYECQVSTHPPLISRIHLKVHPPVVKIVEAGGRELRDKYYERNSTLKLACRVRHLASKDKDHVPTITWLHAGRILNDDTLRGGVSVKTEAVDSGADSTLLVARLNSSDSGIYTCSVANLQTAVNVHVLNESLAELHQGGSQRIPCPSLLTLLLQTFLLTLLAHLLQLLNNYTINTTNILR